MMNEDKIIKTLEKLPFILEQNKIEVGNEIKMIIHLLKEKNNEIEELKKYIERLKNKIDTKNEIINSMEKEINKMGEEIENVKRTSADIDILNLIANKVF